MRLSDREDLGRKDAKQAYSTYRITAERVPRRLTRAVATINAANRMPGMGFEATEEDAVKGTKRFMWLVLLVLAAVIINPTLWQHTHDLIFLAAVPLLAAIAFNGAFGLLTRETFCEFFAARIFGVPACPRLYINRALRKGQVEEEHHTPAD